MDVFTALRSFLNFMAFAVIYQCVFRYWHYFSNRGVKCVRGWPFVGTHWRRMLAMDTWTTALQRCYKAFPTEPFIGVYDPMGHPGVMIRSPLLAKRMLTESSDHFADRAFGADGRSGVDGLLSGSLKIWSTDEYRSKMPMIDFNENHMLSTSGEIVRQMVDRLLAVQNLAYEVSGELAKFASHVMAARCFGLSSSQTDEEFTKRISSLTELADIKRLAYRCAPDGMHRLMGNASNVCYFRQLVSNTEGKMTASLAETLRRSKKPNAGSGANQDDDIVSQCLHFYLKGYKLITSHLSFAVHELTVNSAVQQRLYIEISAMNHDLPNGHSPSLEQLTQMPFMSMVVSEVLRRWPVAPITDCVAIKPLTVATADERFIELNEGDGILLPTHAIHMDAEYYVDPEKFDPNRFGGEQIRSECFFPFGNEPVNEITLLTLKMAIYHLLLSFEFKKCEKTQDPLRLDNGGEQNVMSRRGFWTIVQRRER